MGPVWDHQTGPIYFEAFLPLLLTIRIGHADP